MWPQTSSQQLAEPFQGSWEVNLTFNSNTLSLFFRLSSQHHGHVKPTPFLQSSSPRRDKKSHGRGASSLTSLFAIPPGASSVQCFRESSHSYSSHAHVAMSQWWSRTRTARHFQWCRIFCRKSSLNVFRVCKIAAHCCLAWGMLAFVWPSLQCSGNPRHG